ncbi:ankyrin repeat domain-containing protein [Aspergillus stella-maris]|uniref:ankyrin repeat domain-containing protein n=1 Tax=Aspergillus stella-maris TaxID=1810926 RepID=UPI003CCDE71C
MAEQTNGRDPELWKLLGTFANNPRPYGTESTKWKTALLVCAIRDDQLSAVQLLAGSGADNSMNALYVAARRKDQRYVRCLMEHGADPNTPFWRRTPLHEAILGGFVDTAAALIDGGADVNQLITHQCRDEPYFLRRFGLEAYGNPVGATPSIQACGFVFHPNKPELAVQLARLLLERGADPAAANT